MKHLQTVMLNSLYTCPTPLQASPPNIPVMLALDCTSVLKLFFLSGGSGTRFTPKL